MELKGLENMDIQKMSDNDLIKEFEKTVAKMAADDAISQIYTNEMPENKELIQYKDMLKKEILFRIK